MPTRNVNRTDELDRFVGAKLAALRSAIDKGDASGIAKGDVFARVRKDLKAPGARR